MRTSRFYWSSGPCAPSHTTGLAYRFAGFVCLRKALRWGACRSGSGPSGSEHSHSLLWKTQNSCGSERLLSLVEKKKRHVRTHIYLTLALWIFCFIQNTIHFYLFIQRAYFINNFSDKVTLCNCGIWVSCILKIQKVLLPL